MKIAIALLIGACGIALAQSHLTATVESLTHDSSGGTEAIVRVANATGRHYDLVAVYCAFVVHSGNARETAFSFVKNLRAGETVVLTLRSSSRAQRARCYPSSGKLQ